MINMYLSIWKQCTVIVIGVLKKKFDLTVNTRDKEVKYTETCHVTHAYMGESSKFPKS